MAFEVLPAVDVAGGHLARLTGNGTVGLDAFGGDPLAAATAFAGKGARWIHVVDLDRALTGASRSPGVVAAIAALPGIRVQASGGIVQAGDAAGPLEDGASRVVLGSGALADRASFERTVDSLGDAVVVGLEVAGERVHPRGAAEVELSLEDTLGWLGDVEVPRYLFTDLERFGRLSGTDV